jgi:hypothetical protein
LLPEVFIFQPQLVLDLIIDSARDANASPLSETLYPGRYVNTISVYASLLLNHIPKVDTNPKLHLAGWR